MKKLNKATEIEILKIMAVRHGTIINYYSNSMQVKDGLIKVESGFLDKESFDFLIEMGFTIVEL
jgi:aspartate carbamoyltransferase regulatory subunit